MEKDPDNAFLTIKYSDLSLMCRALHAYSVQMMEKDDPIEKNATDDLLSKAVNILNRKRALRDNVLGGE